MSLYHSCCQTHGRKFVPYYRPQTKFAKVMFLHVSVCPQGKGACMAGGMHGRGACMTGGVHGWRAYMVGGMHGRRHLWQGACMAGGCAWLGGMRGRGMCVGGHAGQGTQVSPPRPILRVMVNERAVHILLECILVIYIHTITIQLTGVMYQST